MCDAQWLLHPKMLTCSDENSIRDIPEFPVHFSYTVSETVREALFSALVLIPEVGNYEGFAMTLHNVSSDLANEAIKLLNFPQPLGQLHLRLSGQALVTPHARLWSALRGLQAHSVRLYEHSPILGRSPDAAASYASPQV
jgi:hypothetical protein